MHFWGFYRLHRGALCMLPRTEIVTKIFQACVNITCIDMEWNALYNHMRQSDHSANNRYTVCS